MGRLTWQGPPATTNGNAVRGLWGASARPSQVRFRRMDRSHGVRCGKHTGGLRQGRRSVGGTHRRGGGLPRRRTFRFTEIVPRVCPRYDGATEWDVHRRGQLARSWRSAISEG